jgi:hypothetical protein
VLPFPTIYKFVPVLLIIREDILDGTGRKLKGSSNSILMAASMRKWSLASYVKREKNIKTSHSRPFVITSTKRSAVARKEPTGGSRRSTRSEHM